MQVCLRIDEKFTQLLPLFAQCCLQGKHTSTTTGNTESDLLVGMPCACSLRCLAYELRALGMDLGRLVCAEINFQPQQSIIGDVAQLRRRQGEARAVGAGW